MTATAERHPRITQYTAEDGYRPLVRIWEAPTPRRRVVLLHGVVSHGGWYLESCRELAAAGLEVHALERRGSGLNAAARGDVPSYGAWIGDVETYLATLDRSLPRILLGVSWGGKLAVAVAKRSPQLVDALGMLCPGLFAPRAPKALLRGLISTANALGFGQAKASIPLKDPALFTGNPRWQEYIRRDPLALRKITLRFAREDAALDRFVSDAAPQIKCPTLLMLAGADRITANDRLREFFARIAAPSKKLVEYPSAGHTLEFEPDPSTYFADLVAWIHQLSTASPPLNERRA